MQPNETMSKKFIITVDTEGDNLWNWRAGDSVSTENSRYIPRFQELCDKYGFKPVYLTNYEMACCDRFMDAPSSGKTTARARSVCTSTLGTILRRILCGKRTRGRIIS